MGYTTAQLKDVFRRETQDNVFPFTWSDPEVWGFMNEAQVRFAEDTLLFIDKTTTAIATGIVVTADVPNVTIDPRVIDVRRVELNTAQRKLKIINFNQLSTEAQSNDYGIPLGGDRELTVKGPPNLIIFDEEINSARLAPIPTTADTLNMHVIRRPINQITSDSVALEVTEFSDQRSGLLAYMKYLAYSYDDEDLGSEKRAERALALYQTSTVARRAQIRQQRRVVGVTAYGGITLQTGRIGDRYLGYRRV